MMYWGNGMGGWGMALMAVSNLVLLGLVIAAVVAAVHYVDRRYLTGGLTGQTTTPQQLLAARFARGDISEDEYTHRLAVLSASPHGDSPPQ